MGWADNSLLLPDVLPEMHKLTREEETIFIRNNYSVYRNIIVVAEIENAIQ